MNVKALRLITGEDIICEYLINEDIVEMKNPVQVSLIPSRSSGNQPNFGFMPFPLTSNDKSIIIDKKHVLFTCEPAEEFLNQYNTLFGSGIVTPPKGLII